MITLCSLWISVTQVIFAQYASLVHNESAQDLIFA